MLASGLKKWTIWAPSINLATASSKSDGHSTSKQDSKSDFWSLLRTPCLDRDNRHSRLQTGGRYSFPWRALSCKCLSSFIGAVHKLAFVVVFVPIAREVDFVHNYWLVRGMRRLQTASDVPQNRNAAYFLLHVHPWYCGQHYLAYSLVSIMTTSWLSSSKGLPASWIAMTSALVCAKNLCWTLGLRPWCLRTAFFRVSMPASNSVMTRAISGPATAHSVNTHSSLRLRVAQCIFFGRIQSSKKGFAFWQWWKSTSKRSLESWVFHSHVHHLAHVHRQPAIIM